MSLSPEDKPLKTTPLHRTIGKVLFGIGLFLLLLFGGLQFSFVQTYLAKAAAVYLSEKTGFPTKIEALSIRWFDDAVLKKVEIKDPEGRPMIYAGQLSIDYRISSLLLCDTKISIDRVALCNAQFYLLAGKDKMNINRYIDSFSSEEKEEKKDTGPAADFVIREIVLEKSSFAFADPSMEAPGPGEFNYTDFKLEELSGTVKNLLVGDKIIELFAKKLRFKEKATDLDVKELSCRYAQTDTTMEFTGMRLQFDRSYYQDTLIFRFKDIGEMGDFNEKVDILALTDSARIEFADLVRFAPSLAEYPDAVSFKARFEGKVSDFESRESDIRFGKNSRVSGNVRMRGLPEVDSTDVWADIRFARIDPADLAIYAGADVAANLAPVGVLETNGRFKGRFTDFNYEGSGTTQLGDFQTNTDFRLADEYLNTQTDVKNFRIGQFVPDLAALFPHAHFAVNLKGKGFAAESADYQGSADISGFHFSGYDYTDFLIDFVFAEQNLTAELRADDPNFQASLITALNLKSEDLHLELTLDTANLQQLGFMFEPTFIKTDIYFDLHGFDENRFASELNIEDLYLAYESKDWEMKKLNAVMVKSGESTELDLVSDMLKADLQGNFDPGRLSSDLAATAREYTMFFTGEDSLSREYYSRKIYKPADYSLNYRIELLDVNPLVNVFTNEFLLSRNTAFSGSVLADSLGISMNASGFVDTLSYRRNTIFDSEIFAATEKPFANDSLGLRFALSSGRQNFNDKLMTENFAFNGRLKGKKIELSADIKRQDAGDEVQLRAEAEILSKGNYRIRADSSKIRLMDQLWTAVPGASLSILGEEVHFKNFTFSENMRSFGLDGSLSEHPDVPLFFHLKNMDISVLSGIAGMKLEGYASADLEIKDVYGNLSVQQQFSIENIKIEHFEIGDIYASSGWNAATESLFLNGEMRREGRRVIGLKGAYYAQKEESKQLAFSADLAEAELSVIEPFIKDYLSDLKGKLSGNITLGGSPNYPVISGGIDVKDGSLRVLMTNCVYHFSDRLYFNEDGIEMRDFALHDGLGGFITLRGGVYHSNFSDIIIRTKGRFSNLKVLDTEISPTEIYYGKAFLSGTFAVTGPPDDLDVSADVKTEKFTKLYLPLDGYSSAEEHKKFIRFVQKPDEETGNSNLPEILEEHSSMKMNINVEVTPEAYCEIIFDKLAGDIIRGRGKGRLRIEAENTDDFKMYGQVDITEGAYNFTFLNLVNKEFTVGDHSTINWNGDPFGGTMNIKAQYTQSTSLAPIIDADSSILNRPEVRRRYPVRVDLYVTGELMKPSVKFDIDVLDYPSTILAGNIPIPLGSYVAAFKSRLRSDEQELNRQVFSLMALKQLTSANSFAGIGQSAGGSVSELLTNQLSNWISQMDENLEIGLDLNGLDADALKTFQLRLSYSFLNGRMKIRRDGGFVNAQNEADPYSVIGDWTLEYLITRDGRVRLKMYHKNAPTIINAGGLKNNSMTGISILHSRSFNNLRDLLPKRRREDE